MRRASWRSARTRSMKENSRSSIDSSSHLEQIGLCLVPPGRVLGPAHAERHAPALEILQEHRDPSFGQRQLGLDLGGRQGDVAQVEQRPYPALVPLEAPELDDVAHRVDGDGLPGAQASRRADPGASACVQR